MALKQGQKVYLQNIKQLLNNILFQWIYLYSKWFCNILAELKRLGLITTAILSDKKNQKICHSETY